MATKYSDASAPFPSVDFSGIQSLFQPQLDFWLKTQESLLTAWQSSVDGWFDHRRAAIEQTRDFIHHLAECKDVTELASLQQRWFTGAMERLSADARSFVATASRQNAELVSGTSWTAPREVASPPAGKAAA